MSDSDVELQHILVSGLVGDSEGQAQPRVLIDGAAAVLAAHAADGGEA